MLVMIGCWGEVDKAIVKNLHEKGKNPAGQLPEVEVRMVEGTYEETNGRVVYGLGI